MKERIKRLGISSQFVYQALKENGKINMAERTFYLHLEKDFKNLTDDSVKKNVNHVLNKFEEFKKELFLK